jgi:omega-6 fatty acid desaturase (delta-12 desaturase)
MMEGGHATTGAHGAASSAQAAERADAAGVDETERVRRMRECLRALRAYHADSIARPISDVAVHGFVYLMAVILVLAWPNSIVGGIAIVIVCYKAGRLFEVGHDACHGSYTPSSRLNRWIGRLAFLPSLHVFSLWRFGHNVLHHGYSNLRGKDFVWVPLSKAEHDALPWWGRGLHRFYRHHSAIGMPLYYVVELWLPRLIVPRREHLRAALPGLSTDLCLMGGFIIVMAAACVAAASIAAAPGDMVLLGAVARFAAAVIIPFVYTSGMIGFVVYFNHTHPDIPWYRDATDWNFARAQMEETTCLRFEFAGYVFGIEGIMSHTVHHIDPRVPLYRLREARDCISRILGDWLIDYRFTLRECVAIMRACKLYDYDAQCWVAFSGQRTSEPKRRGAPVPAR